MKHIMFCIGFCIFVFSLSGAAERATDSVPKGWKMARWSGTSRSGAQSFFSVTYPEKMFQEKKADAGVELQTAYHVDDFPVSILFEVKPGETLDVVKKTGINCFTPMPFGGRGYPHNPDRDCFSHADGKFFITSTPAEWAIKRVTYSDASISRNAPETLVITENMLDYKNLPDKSRDFKKLDLDEQDKLLQNVINSLTFKVHYGLPE